MRALRLAVLFVAALLSPQVAPSAGAVQLTISSPSANAGDVETFTITRSSGGNGVYVLFQTADGTAKAGLDYVATKQLIYLKGSQTSATVTVPTLTNPGATGTLTFKAAVASGSTGVGAVASIIEPAPAPTAQWVPAAMVDGGYARCKTVGGCHGYAPPYPDIVAQQGDVLMYAWNGVAGNGPDSRIVGAFWPQGHYPRATKVASDWYLGVEGFADEWEGVTKAPAVASGFVSREGLVYRVVSREPDLFSTTPDEIVGVQFDHDTTGKYYLAGDPVFKAETLYFMASDVVVAP